MNQAVVEFHRYVIEDVLDEIPNITSKRMFGGYGIYKSGAIFAIILSGSELYFKVDKSNQADYEALDSHQFTYTGHKNKKPTLMPYWTLPEEIMEDKELLALWVEKSVAISSAAKG